MGRSRAVAPSRDRYGNLRETQTGILLPERVFMRHTANSYTDDADLFRQSNFSGRSFARGTSIMRDKASLAPKWFEKGSGLDDFISAQLVDGNIANIGIAPVVEPKLSALLTRQQNEAAAAALDITGRKTPVRRALNAVSRFNDSPLGVSSAIKQIVYGMRVYNRGAPIATVPVTYDMSQWGDYGLDAVPLPRNGQAESDADRFYLDVDYSRWQPVPFLPSVFDLEPTGNPHYPYWYRARDGKERRWVLLHHTHVIQMIPGTSYKRGIGTSAVWQIVGELAEYILVKDARIERSMYGLADGLMVVQGISESPEVIRKALEDQRESARNQGMGVAKGTAILTENPGEGASPLNVMHIRYRDHDPEYTEYWKQEIEDVLAICFNEPLSSVVTRGGVGYGAQAETVANNAAEVGVGSILIQVAAALGAIYPRVTFSIKRQNDRAQRLNVETMGNFADAVAALNNSVGEGEPKPFDAATIRQIVGRDFIDLPEPDESTGTTGTNDEATGERDDDQGNDEALVAGHDHHPAGCQCELHRTPATLDVPLDVRHLDVRDITVPEGDVVFDNGLVQITQGDIDLAIQEGRERLGDDFAGLLEAEAEGTV